MMHVTLLAMRYRIARPISPPPEIPLVGLPHLADSRDAFPPGALRIIKKPSVRSRFERVFSTTA